MSLFGYAMGHKSLQQSSAAKKKLRRKRKRTASSQSMTDIGRLRQDHDDEVERMKRQFSALLGKWSELQRRLVDSETPSPTSTSTLTDTEPTTKFIRRRASREASPPPIHSSMPRMGEPSTSSMMPSRNVSSSNLEIAEAAQHMSEDEDDDEAQDLQTEQMDASEEKDLEPSPSADEGLKLQLEQQRKTIASLTETIASLRQSQQDRDANDAVIGETRSDVRQMAVSLAALQQKVQDRGACDYSALMEKLVAVEHNTQLVARQQELQDEIATLTQQNREKDAAISEAASQLELMSATLRATQRKLQARGRAESEQVVCKQGVLTKVQGDRAERLRLGRKSRKHVFFAGNRLFWSDVGTATQKQTPTFKSMEVREVLNRVVVTANQLKQLNDESIQKHTQRPWFLVVGEKRCALFEAEGQAERDAWVKFIRRALR